VALLAIGYPENASPAEKDRLPLEAIVKHEQWE
jgi:hypothetical protein